MDMVEAWWEDQIEEKNEKKRQWLRSIKRHWGPQEQLQGCCIPWISDGLHKGWEFEEFLEYSNESHRAGCIQGPKCKRHHVKMHLTYWEESDDVEEDTSEDACAEVKGITFRTVATPSRNLDRFEEICVAASGSRCNDLVNEDVYTGALGNCDPEDYEPDDNDFPKEFVFEGRYIHEVLIPALTPRMPDTKGQAIGRPLDALLSSCRPPLDRPCPSRRASHRPPFPLKLRAVLMVVRRSRKLLNIADWSSHEI